MVARGRCPGVCPSSAQAALESQDLGLVAEALRGVAHFESADELVAAARGVLHGVPELLAFARRALEERSDDLLEAPRRGDPKGPRSTVETVNLSRSKTFVCPDRERL